MLKGNQPIGIFDSGVGGLTVANAIRQLLPNEHLIYFGDTFHLPYGDKSSDSVRYYSSRITDFLLEKKCKIIVIACNTASANAFETVQQHVNNKAIVLNVIDPVVEYVVNINQYKRIGVIGTKGTINSGTYPKKIHAINKNLKVASMATPLLVPMIEEGFIFDDISNAIIRNYLSKKELGYIESLILGCTHYPIIKNQIAKYYNFSVNVVDSAHIVARKLQELLTGQGLLNNQKKGEQQFYVSDYTDFFNIIAKMFFEQDIQLTKLDFWK
jgi:glutamate racemase